METRRRFMTLRVNDIISPASAAGHAVLSSNLTAWDIHGTQPCRQMPGPCPPHGRKEGHPRRRIAACIENSPF